MSCKKPKKRVEIVSSRESMNQVDVAMLSIVLSIERLRPKRVYIRDFSVFDIEVRFLFLRASIVTTVAKMEQMAACFNFILPNAKRSSIVKGMRGGRQRLCDSLVVISRLVRFIVCPENFASCLRFKFSGKIKQFVFRVHTLDFV